VSYYYGDDDDMGERMDADMQMAELQRLGRRAAKLKKQGVCVHGAWRATVPAVCKDCGKSFANEAELMAERNRLLGA
jgi:hypothetical protein